MAGRVLLASFAAMAVGALCACVSSGAGAPEIQVTLKGASEIPPNVSSASGKASFWVHADRTLNGIVETSGIDDTAANLYQAGTGENGPLVFELVRTGSDGLLGMESAPVSAAGWSVPRSARFSEEQYQAFVAGQIYVNVHSARYPDGEIRAQLKP
jgi:hypothetical protein